MRTIGRGGAKRRVFLALLALVAVTTLIQAAPAPAALPPFGGGPITADCPTVVANDHSVNALRFSATGLTPDTTYYVKLRFSPNTTPAGSDNRGFTWNGTSQAWVQERTDDWTAFPSITTDASGDWIGTGSSDWFYLKFGDTTKTGDYYLLVSLSTGTQGNTANCDTPVPVAVRDAETATYRVHPGQAAGSAGKRVDVVHHADVGDSGAAPLSLNRTETNGCDDDSNGTVDDEVAGVQQTGGFRLAVPTDTLVDLRIQKAVWPADSTGLTHATPDVDIALGASDMNPPTAPASLVAVAGAGSVELTWTEATDDTAVTGYDIYRWSDAQAGAGYTAPARLIASVSSATLTYSDSSVAAGSEHHYIIRARDGATNVGPRSAQADISLPAPTVLTLQASKSTVDWKAPATLSGALTVAGGTAAVEGKQVRLEQSLTGTGNWTPLGELLGPVTANLYSVLVIPIRATFYRLNFAGDGDYAESVSSAVKVTPRVKLGTPVAPKTAARRRAFTVYGSLVPRHTPGARNVKIKCYRKASSGAWVLKKTVSAKNADYGSYTRYKARFMLPSAGSWRLIAKYAATAKYAASASGARYVRVK